MDFLANTYTPDFPNEVKTLHVHFPYCVDTDAFPLVDDLHLENWKCFPLLETVAISVV